MLQAFGWDSCNKGEWYVQLHSKVANIKAAGFTHVWLPPPSQSVSAQGYLPGQLYNLNSKYGTDEDLKLLTMALNAASVAPMADIVINHRCADEKGPDGKYNSYRDDISHRGHRIDWGKWAITCNDPIFGGTGNPDTGDDYGAAPDLDHANPELREALKEWMGWLADDIGFRGWRFDFARGFAAEYIKEYVHATLSEGSVCVGEYWSDLKWNGSELERNQDDSRQRLVDWINKCGRVSAAFDFPTKGILNEATKRAQYSRLRDARGRPPGLLGWAPDRAVTFVENHDTGSTQQHWPFPDDKLEVGYAYILTHPGVPCVFWDHVSRWGGRLHDAIATLVAVRRRNSIKASSQVEILCAEDDIYVARVARRLTVKLGPRFEMGKHLPLEKDGWALAAAGNDWAVWEKPQL